jgi:hypothetical protein
MDSASQGTTTGGGALAVDVSLEFLKFVRHHFLSKVLRCTPSGRQQSAIMLLLPDALCLLSHRGGLHTYVPLKNLVAISVYPRARMCFHVKRRHDLLITCTQQPRLVNAVSQLFLGLTGTQLPVHQDESPPSLDSLQLRPSSDFHACVPPSLMRTLRAAALSAASFGAATAAAALVDPNAEHPTQSLPNYTSPIPHRIASRHQDTAAPLHGDLHNSSFEVQDGVGFSNGGGESTLDARSRDVLHHVGTMLHGNAVGSARCSPLFADPSSGSTILVVESTASSTVLTVPAYRSLWEYLTVLSERLPGATAPPAVFVKCVEWPHKQLTIHSRLFHQTMLLFADEHPHMVTLQKRRTDEGHQFDGSVLWLSLMETSGR